MFTVYRGVILALGLVLAAAGPPQENGNQPPDSPAYQIERSLEDMAASLREVNKPSDLNQPCDQGDNKRTSDLCAQWKAADAAESASKATWIFGALGSLIGAFTLAAAVGAAIYARDAAIQGKRGADAADKSLAQAHSGLRAWIMAVPHYKLMYGVNDERFVEFSIRWHNRGQTPGLRTEIFGGFADQLTDERIAEIVDTPTAIGPGEDWGSYPVSIPLAEMAEILEDGGRRHYQYRSVVTYWDIFEKAVRRSDVLVEFHYRDRRPSTEVTFETFHAQVFHARILRQDVT